MANVAPTDGHGTRTMNGTGPAIAANGGSTTGSSTTPTVTGTNGTVHMSLGAWEQNNMYFPCFSEVKLTSRDQSILDEVCFTPPKIKLFVCFFVGLFVCPESNKDLNTFRMKQILENEWHTLHAKVVVIPIRIQDVDFIDT